MPDGISGGDSKTFVLDISAVLYDTACVDPSRTPFGANTVLIPISTLRTLSTLESDPRKGGRAREAMRLIESYFPNFETMKHGVRTHGGGTMRIVGLNGDGDRNNGGDRFKTMVDFLQKLKKRDKVDPILVAKSAGMRAIVRSNGFKVEDLLSGKVARPQSLAPGIVDIGGVPELVIEELNQKGSVGVEDITLPHDLHPNACCRLRDPRGKGVLALFIGGNRMFVVRRNDPDRKGVHPKNDEQRAAYELCLRPEIGIVNVVGGAGTGKTLMALLAAEKLRRDPLSPIRQIVVFRPLSEVGPALGTLPGDAQEKFAPWTAPIVANLRFIYRGESTQADEGDEDGNKKSKQDKHAKAMVQLDGYFRTGVIKILPATFERGTTIDESFIIIDEAQNFTPHELLTLLTRAGRGSKIVITGDFSQIDNEELDAESCGLAKALERTKGHHKFASIELVVGERSELATLVAMLFRDL